MLTQDPIGLAGGVNLYAYAGNNPTSFSDPWGLKQCPPDCDGYPSTSMNHEAMVAAVAAPMPQVKGAIEGFLPNNVLNVLVGEGVGKLVGAVLGRVGAALRPTVSVTHATSVEGAAAIESSGALQPNSWVTTPGAIAGRTAAQIETTLEIGAGKGAMQSTFKVPADALRVATPPLTSGGAPQFRTNVPILLGPGSFTPSP